MHNVVCLDRIQGIIVNEVIPGSSAANRHSNGRYDVSVNHKLAISAIETMDQVADIRPGSGIMVEILRHGKKLAVEVTIRVCFASN